MYILPEALCRAILILGRLKVWNFSARSRRSRLVSLGILRLSKFGKAGHCSGLGPRFNLGGSAHFTSRSGWPGRPRVEKGGRLGGGGGQKRPHPAWSRSFSLIHLPWPPVFGARAVR